MRLLKLFQEPLLISNHVGVTVPVTGLRMTTVSGPQLHEDSSLGSGSNQNEDRAVGNCGVGPCRPRWLQVFAKPIWFMLLLNTYCCVEGAIVSGKIIIMFSSTQHMLTTN